MERQLTDAELAKMADKIQADIDREDRLTELNGELLESGREALTTLTRLYAFCGNIPPQLSGRTHSCIGRLRSAIDAVEAAQQS